MDIFQSYELDTSILQATYETQKLNDLLVDRVDFTDLGKNFDTILEELILNYKNRVPPNSPTIQVKNLILALTTLKGDNECNHYGHKILLNNYLVIGERVRFLKRNEALRRLDKILLHYINEHVNNCEQVYFRKFDEVSKNFDDTLIKRLNLFLGKAIDTLTSEQNPDNHGEQYTEILYNLVNFRIGNSFEMNAAYIYNAMKNLVKGDSDASFLRLVENEKTGFLNIRRDKFIRLFNEYVTKPCQYFETSLGPDIFEPALFDNMFYYHIRVDRVSFYEAWLKYRLCTFSGKIGDKLDEVLDYADNQWKLKP